MIMKMPGKLFTATPDGQKFILNQNNCANLVLMNCCVFNRSGIWSTSRVAQYMIHENTNLLPKTTLEKSVMKSSGILKERAIQNS